jgi:flavin reductase ActVB
MDEVTQAAFRGAMARFPTGVAIVTTIDRGGWPYGFTASSFCPVSLDPPLVLVCLAESANSYPVFCCCARFAVSILGEHQADLAHRFASKRPDKFATGGFTRTRDGLMLLDGAIATIECRIHDRHKAGDHLIIVGRVHRVRVSDGVPAVYADRAFGGIHRLAVPA